jgi:hypothetical protein
MDRSARGSSDPLVFFADVTKRRSVIRPVPGPAEAVILAGCDESGLQPRDGDALSGGDDSRQCRPLLA